MGNQLREGWGIFFLMEEERRRSLDEMCICAVNLDSQSFFIHLLKMLCRVARCLLYQHLAKRTKLAGICNNFINIYEQLFCTTVCCTAFLYKQLVFVIFWQMEMGERKSKSWA